MKEQKGWGVYDERQIAVRGQAFKWGFITLIVALAVYIYGIFRWSWMEPAVACVMCIVAGVGVFLGISIYGGAYHCISTENTKRAYVYWLVIGVMDLVQVATYRSIISDGKLSSGALYLETAIIFFALAAIDIAARIRNKRQENEAED